MSNVAQCKNCGKLFQSLGSRICPSCTDELDANFEKVKNYIYDNPNANVVDISNGTGVSEKTVLHFLKEGRLSLGDASCVLECERCGEPIPGGRFCKRCQSIFEKEFGSIGLQPAKKEDEGRSGSGLGKMHFKIK